MTNLRDILSYEPGTGVLTWLVHTRNCDRSGSEAGCVCPRGYRSVTYKGVRYQAHRLAWFLSYGKWPAHHIDHINGNKDDNRLCNLREATQSQNVMNCPPSAANKSGVRGVYFLERKQKWEAAISVEGRRKKFGPYIHFEDAVRARRDAEAKLFGEFARLAALDEKIASFSQRTASEALAKNRRHSDHMG